MEVILVLRDYLRLSMKSLRRRSLRSWLTILGIVVGVAAVVALIAIGEGMQQSVKQQFDTIGYNTIILGEATGKSLFPGAGMPAVPSAPTGRGGAATDTPDEEEPTKEPAEEMGEGKPAWTKLRSDLTPEEIEAMKAQYGGEGRAIAKPMGDLVTSGSEGEPVDLEVLRVELMAAVLRDEMTPEEGAWGYAAAGVRIGEWTRAEAQDIGQRFMQEAAAQATESGGNAPGEAPPVSPDAPDGPQETLATADMLGIEVLETLAELPSVAAAGAQREETALVSSEGLQGIGVLRLIGMTPSMPDDFPLYFEGYAIAEGRSFAEEDLLVIVLGPGVANDLAVGVGDEMTVQGTAFEVIGILAEPEQVGGGFTVGDTKFSLFVPIPALEALFGNEGTFSMAFVEVADGASIDGVAQQARDAFTQAGMPISATTASELSAEIGAAVSSVNLTLSAIAGIALLVGVLGVMNTMYTSVLERTREIGILKAVGAKDRDVLGLFLTESALLGLIGGGLGVLLGVGISGLAGSLISGSLAFGTVSQVAESAGLQAGASSGLPPSFSAWLILAALGLSLLLGTLAGLLPAWRGAKLPPVKALRYE